jgi:hypothetical protein
MEAIGTLAYGSLIANPGPEIESAIIHRIKCKTPFKVEFACINRKLLRSSGNSAGSFMPSGRQNVGSARLLRDLAAYRFCTLPERNRRRFWLRAVPGVLTDRR